MLMGGRFVSPSKAQGTCIVKEVYSDGSVVTYKRLFE